MSSLMLHAKFTWSSDPEFPSALQAKLGRSHGSSQVPEKEDL